MQVQQSTLKKMKPINMTIPHLKKSIGRSSSRLALLLIALVFACLGIRQSAQAGYIVTLQEVGSDVVATGSGAINLTGLTFVGHSPFLLYPVIAPSAATIRGLISSQTFTPGPVDRRVSGTVTKRFAFAIAAARWSG